MGSEGIGVTDLEMTPFSLVSLGSDMSVELVFVAGSTIATQYVLFELSLAQDMMNYG